jgi:hypothetical protein
MLIILAILPLACTDHQSVLKAKSVESRAKHAKEMVRVNSVFNLAVSRNISAKEFNGMIRPITAANILQSAQNLQGQNRFKEVYAKRLTAYLQNLDYAPAADSRVLELASAPETPLAVTFRSLNDKFNHGNTICQGKSSAYCFAAWMIESEKISVNIEQLSLDDSLSYRQLLLSMMEQIYAK